MPPQSVYQQLRLSAEQYADHPFLHFPAIALGEREDFDATYSQVLERTEALKQLYVTSGLSAGDRVAILLENKPAFFFHWIALNALGVCVVPINGELMISEASYLIENSDARCVIGFEHKLDYLRQAVDAAGLSLPIIADTQVESLSLEVLNHTALNHTALNHTALNLDSGSSIDGVGLQTECAILYTSGSTGKPKGCILSNEYFLLSGEKYRDAGGYCRLEFGSERLITPLPLVHMNAMACSSMAMMMSGGCLIQLDRFHPKTWWQTVRECRQFYLNCQKPMTTFRSSSNLATVLASTRFIMPCLKNGLASH